MGCLFSRPDFTAGGYRVKLNKVVAEGGFSQVFIASDVDSGDQYAVKKMTARDEGDVKKIKWEIEVNELCKHVNIAELIGWAQEGLIYQLVYPFYARGSFFDMLIKRRATKDYLPEKEVLAWFKGMCEAVEVVHQNGIAHRDIKTANFLIADETGQPVLIDFGSSIRYGLEILSYKREKVPVSITNSREMQMAVDDAAENCSMPYRAPELFSCEIGCVIDKSVDIWALGCCLYALCHFVSPFDLAYENGNSVGLAVLSPEKIPYPEEAPYQSSTLTLIRKMLVVDPTMRPEIAGVLAVLNNLICNTTQNA